MTGLIFKKRASIAAGSQFLGTEFTPQVKKGKDARLLRLKAVHILKGAESATWKIVKTVDYTAPDSGAAPASPVKQHVLWQSLDGAGAPAANTDTDVTVAGADAEAIILLPGEQVQIVTTGLSAAAVATIVYEELVNLPEQSYAQSRGTR